MPPHQLAWHSAGTPLATISPKSLEDRAENTEICENWKKSVGGPLLARCSFSVNPVAGATRRTGNRKSRSENHPADPAAKLPRRRDFLVLPVRSWDFLTPQHFYFSVNGWSRNASAPRFRLGFSIERARGSTRHTALRLSHRGNCLRRPVDFQLEQCYADGARAFWTT